MAAVLLVQMQLVLLLRRLVPFSACLSVPMTELVLGSIVCLSAHSHTRVVVAGEEEDINSIPE